MVYQDLVSVDISLPILHIEKKMEISKDEIEEKCDSPYSSVNECILNLINRNQKVDSVCFGGDAYENPESIKETKEKCGLEQEITNS